MVNKGIMRFSLIVTLFLCAKCFAIAQTDPIEHLWFNEEKTAKIQIYKAVNGKYYGKIVWLKEPNRDGKPKVDRHNPDKKHQNDPILGLLILKNFTKKANNIYEDGEIYDPKNGKNYSCIITQEGDKLDVRGYVGFSFIGRTTIWVLADN